MPQSDYVARWNDKHYVDAYLHVTSGSQPDGAEWAQKLDTNSDGVVLDLGCGEAKLLIALSPYIACGIGVDVSRHQIARGRQNIRSVGITNIELRTVDVRDITFREEELDAVVSLAAIHHISDDAKAQLFVSIRHWLKPGGLFHFHDDTFNFAPEEFEQEAARIRDGHRAKLGDNYEWMKENLCFDDFELCPYLDDLQQMIRASGLAIESVQRCGPDGPHGAIIRSRNPGSDSRQQKPGGDG
ncbi:SAM-dependent methyltransferase [Verrucomicrobiota bacterium]